jgi:Mrp family chromosome partitioning ATPase
MSRISAVLSKADSQMYSRAESPVESVSHPEDYLQMIRVLFHSPAAVALLGACGTGEDIAEGVSEIAENLAAGLSVAGKRVVVVSVDMLLRLSPITDPEETSFMPGKQPEVWLWPSVVGRKIDFPESDEPSGPGNWLDFLRRNFDAVVLDCPGLEQAPGVVEVAAMADAVVLAVEAGITPRQQIRRDQLALQLRGARIVGCILIERGQLLRSH